MPIPPPAASAPAPLPDPLVREVVKALAKRGARPVPPAVGEALETLRRLVRSRPEDDGERRFVEGLAAAARGPAGDRAWAQAVRALHLQRRGLGPGSPALRLEERLGDLQAVQGLPAYPWRDRALAQRLARAKGVDPALEEALLEALVDHWGGFLEVPRPEGVLASAYELLGLWQRRGAEARTELMGRVAFVEHAPALWRFLLRMGDGALRERLRACVAELAPRTLAGAVAPGPFLAWIVALRGGPLDGEVRALVLAMDPWTEATWGFRPRAAALREAGLGDRYRSLLEEGLERLPLEARRELLREELLLLPGLDEPLARRCLRRLEEDPELRRDGILCGAWARRLKAWGLDGALEALAPAELPGPEAEVPKVPEGESGQGGGLFTRAEEEALRLAYEEGRLEDLEAGLWPRLEALGRGERGQGNDGEALSALADLLATPWLRRREPQEALLRLGRIERLLLRLGTSQAREQLAALASTHRAQAERHQHLIGLLGSAAQP